MLVVNVKVELVFGLYEECTQVYKLNPNEQIYINSPFFPDLYPVGTSCRYIVVAPQDFELKFRCSLNLKSVRSLMMNKDFLDKKILWDSCLRRRPV